MRLKHKILALAVIPLVVSLALIAFAVRHQERDLAQRERQLVEAAYMNAKQTELRHYVELAVSTIQPLYDSGRQDDATRREAMRLLAALDYGSDGYFFLYDLEGNTLMHPRQPELVGRNLWELRDPDGQPTIQLLTAKAKAGGGFVNYRWQKPSSQQLAPKLGYVVALPRWHWMLGTGIYLDDVQATLQQLDRQVAANITSTLLWIAGIAVFGVALIGGCGLVLNVSEHKVADAKLRLLARQVVQSQEDERAHLSRELHDGTSQTLVSIKLLIESALDELGREGRGSPAPLARALERIKQALTEVRRISHRLRPALLDTLGLPAALTHLAREFSEHGELHIDAEVEGEAFDLPEDINTVLFRVAQEALTNIEKHAFAKQIDLRLSFAAGGVRLGVADDGRGFDVDSMQLDPNRGIGLRNMRERLEAIGGSFSLQSRPGRTMLVAEVPRAALRRFRTAELAT